MRSAQHWTKTKQLFSFIETVLRLGFPNLKKRHLVGQRRVAVLSSETVPVSPLLPVSITNCVRILCSLWAVINLGRGPALTEWRRRRGRLLGDAGPLPGWVYRTYLVRTTPGRAPAET